jgi:SAM-dependent methyltransferase
MQFEDIICTDCFSYDRCRELQKTRPYSIRACQNSISESFYGRIAGKDVLEIGCGSSKKGGLNRAILLKNGCRWTGIDIKKTDLTSAVCSAEKTPFGDKSFDWVIGSQTLEHWKRPAAALKEIRRVLRDDGRVSLTAPVYLHGSRMFVTGDFEAIETMFVRCGFEVEKAQTWRKSYGDLGPCLNDCARKNLRRHGVADFSGLSMYIVHFILAKSARRQKTGLVKKLHALLAR